MSQTHEQQRTGYRGNRSEMHQQPVSGDLHSKICFAKKPLPEELFNGIAQQAARAVAADWNRNKTSQLRRFYDELCMWEAKIARQPNKFDECLPFIRMLNAKAAYAEGRKLVDRTFVDLLAHTLQQAKSAETLTVCKLFWEAFMGFYKQERGND